MKFLKKEYRNKMSHPANNSAEWLLRYLGLNLALAWWHFSPFGCLRFLPNSKITVHGISDAPSPLFNISMIGTFADYRAKYGGEQPPEQKIRFA